VRLHPAFRDRTLDIVPGFVIEDGRVLAAHLREPICAQTLRQVMAVEIDKANRFGKADREAVESIHRLLAANLEKCRAYLQGCRRDYRLLVRFRSSHAILIRKCATQVDSSIVEDATFVEWDMALTRVGPLMQNDNE